MRTLEPWVFIAASILVLTLAAMMSWFPTFDFDLFMYLAIARSILAAGSFPAVDPFLFSIPNYHWHILHEWAGYFLWYGAYLFGSWTGILIFKTMLIIAVLALISFVARNNIFSRMLTPALMLITIFAAALRFTERTSLFSDVLLAMVLALLLAETRRASRARYTLPIIFLVWVNCHAAFYPGLALVALFTLDRIARGDPKDKRSMVICAAASVIACLCNPLGLGGFMYPLRSAGSADWAAMRASNLEWMPTFGATFGGHQSSIAFSVLLGISSIILALTWRRKPLAEIATWGILAYLGSSAIRFVPPASYALAILTVHLAAQARPQTSHSWAQRLAPWVQTGSIFVSLWLIISTLNTGYHTVEGVKRYLGSGLDRRYIPEKAAAVYRDRHLPGNLFNDHAFGGYLAFLWGDQEKLFYHGFVDDMRFYQESYLGANASPERFAEIVQRYGINTFMLQKFMLNVKKMPFIYHHLLKHPDFALVYQDDVAVIFSRRSASIPTAAPSQ